MAMLLLVLQARTTADEGARWGIDVGGELPPDASLEQVLEKIRTVNGVTSGLIGYGGSSSPVYDAFLRLEQLADEPLLLRLSWDLSPAVRVYAFYALADLQGRVPFAVLLDHLDDLEPVATLRGCIGDERPVFALMRQRIDGQLSAVQRDELERILVQGSRPAKSPTASSP